MSDLTLDQIYRKARAEVDAAKPEFTEGERIKVKDGDAALKRSVQAILRDPERTSLLRAAAATMLIEAKVLEAAA